MGDIWGWAEEDILDFCANDMENEVFKPVLCFNGRNFCWQKSLWVNLLTITAVDGFKFLATVFDVSRTVVSIDISEGTLRQMVPRP